MNDNNALAIRPEIVDAEFVDIAPNAPKIVRGKHLVHRKPTSRGRRERGEGTIYQMKGSKFWWIAYRGIDGKRVQKSTGKLTKTEAAQFLRDELLKLASGYDTSASAIRVKELYPLHQRAWENEGKSAKSLDWQRYTWENHLLPFFGEMKASDVGTRAIDAYVAKRLADVAPDDRTARLRRNSTINKELTILASAFALAYDAQPRLVPRKLSFSRLKESKPRQGFIGEAEYQRLMRHCEQPWLKAFLCVGFRTGMRAGEMLALRVGDVDLSAGFIRIRDSKNGDPRSVPIRFDMREHLTRMIDGKQWSAALFTRPDGKTPVANYHWDWNDAIEKAGIGITVHDLRRSAVRAMAQAGIDQAIAMKISGHKTISMWNRYNIVDEARLREAAERSDAFAVLERKRAEDDAKARELLESHGENTGVNTGEVLQ